MGPDFICIGAQKAGTSWLNRNLRAHPQIWMPPVKGIRYLNNSLWLPLACQALTGSREGRRWRAHARRRIPGLLARRRFRLLCWYGAFYLLPRCGPWYPLLFQPGRGQVSGEITPAYGRLSESEVRRARRIQPQMKIIYLLRNPVERMWSELAMKRRKKGRALAGQAARPLRELFSAESLLNSEYARNLDLWQSLFPPGQIFTGFFDSLAEDPAEFLRAIFRFIGVDPAAADCAATAGERINAGVYEAMPPELEAQLSAHFLQELETLHRRLQHATTGRWLDRARQAMTAGGSYSSSSSSSSS